MAVALTGCIQQGLVSPTTVPATVSTALTITAGEGETFKAGGSAVSFFVVLNDGTNALTIDDRAEPWLETLANDTPRHRRQTTSGSSDGKTWADGKLGEYIVPAGETTVSADGSTLTVQTPTIMGLREPVTLWVKALAASGDPQAVTYAPPPRIDTLTRYGLVNGTPVPAPEDIINIDIDELLEGIVDGLDKTGEVRATMVPSQVATPVAVDGWNIDAGTSYAWVVETTDIPGGNLQNGRFAFSPEINTANNGPARVGMRITNADGQTDFLDLALLATEPPVLQSVVRNDAIGQNLVYSAQQVPANGNAALTICGLRFNQTRCEYVLFSTPAGAEVGRYLVPQVDIDADCIRNVKPPVLANQTATSDLVVTVYFADGSYTQVEAIAGTNVLEVVPPPQIATAEPGSVPATPTANDRNNTITLAGSYVHPSSKVQVRWDFEAINENEGPFGADPNNQNDIVLGDNADLDGEGFIENSDITFGNNTLTFQRPALDTGAGSRGAPVAAAKGRTDRTNEDRDVTFVVVDVWGQTSEDNGPTVTYNAPPQIYAFDVTDGIGTGTATPATRSEKFLVTGLGWDEGATIEFQRQDNGQVILAATAITNFDLVGGVQTHLSETPNITNPPADGNGIPVWAIITNPDGQEVVARITYLAPNATPLTVTNNATGFAEVGAVAASANAPAGIFGRQLRISGFNAVPAVVEFLTADGNLIDNRPTLNDNPITGNGITVAGNDILVEAPQLFATITDDTQVFVRLTDGNGQTTPASQYGVVVYKPAPSNVTISIPNSTPANSMPATTIFALNANPDLTDDGDPTTPALNEIPTEFFVTGDNLESSRPFIRDQGGFVSFQGYAGTIPPGQNGFAGFLSAVAPVSFDEPGTAFGETPSLGGVAVDQVATVAYYDMYGQEAEVTTNEVTVIAPAVVDQFRGVFTNNTGGTSTVSLLAPGRGAAGAPTFSILGDNLNRVTQVRFRFPGNNGAFIGDWETATPQGSPATSVTGPITQATAEQLPFTTNIEAYVRTEDGQVVVVQNIEYTAPPVIVGFAGDVNQFLANTAPGNDQAITVQGLNLADSKASGSEFTVTVSGITVNDVSAATNPVLPQYTAPVNATFSVIADDTTGIAANVLGPIEFTYTSRTGQTNTAILSGDNPSNVEALLGANLFVHAYRGRVQTGGSDNGAVQAAVGVFGSDAFDSVVTVSFGLYDDIEQTGTDVKTMRVDLFKGSAASRQISTTGAGIQTLLVQESLNAAPTRPQFFGSTRNFEDVTFLVAGNFVGDANLDVAVGIPDESAAAGDPAIGAVFIFAGNATGLAPVSATNPIKLQLPAANTPLDTDDFGVALAVGNVTDGTNDDLVVGAPGRTVGGVLNRGEVYVYEGGALTAATAPVQTLGYAAGNTRVGDADQLGESVVVGNLNAATPADEVLAGTPAQTQLVDVTTGAPADPFRTEIGSGIFGIVGTYDTGAPSLLVPFGGSAFAFDWAPTGEQLLADATEYVIPDGVQSTPAAIVAENNERLVTATGNIDTLVKDVNAQFAVEEIGTFGFTTRVQLAPALVGPITGQTVLPAYVVTAPNAAWGFIPRSN
jgi:hypothetical protein